MSNSVIGRDDEPLVRLRSRRSAILGGGLGLAAGALGIAGGRAAAFRQATGAFESGGLGLTSDEFDARYGPSEVGQGAIIYQIDGEQFAVKGTQGIDAVTSVNWFAPNQELVDFEVAIDLISRFFPADAKLREIYTTPAAGIFPFATSYLYKSVGLASVLAGGPTVTSGNFLVAFQLAGDFGSQVSAVNAFVGMRPSAGSDG